MHYDSKQICKPVNLKQVEREQTRRIFFARKVKPVMQRNITIGAV